ncbi:MAG TPA: IS1 family transposase [Lacunisphaera sp.]|nr:IS1 family transposase [Lacunisphaera sp.]
MANHLSFDKQVMAISALAEGNSIRSIERMTGVHRDTIMRLGVRVGEACRLLMHEQMRGLDCKHIQVDEIWGFVGRKQRNVDPNDNPENYGDAWTFVALDPESKLVPCYHVGKRDWEDTNTFVHDLSTRVKNRIQLSSDGMNQYLNTVEDAFGDAVDYGQIVKVYGGADDVEQQRRYSPPPVTAVTKKAVSGSPDLETVSTSHVERQNLTTRMHCRRLTRLTNAFSKKFEHFQAAIGLNYGYYNYCLIHKTIRMTPAMAAGVSSRIWTVSDLVERAQ